MISRRTDRCPWSSPERFSGGTNLCPSASSRMQMSYESQPKGGTISSKSYQLIIDLFLSRSWLALRVVTKNLVVFHFAKIFVIFFVVQIWNFPCCGRDHQKHTQDGKDVVNSPPDDVACMSVFSASSFLPAAAKLSPKALQKACNISWVWEVLLKIWTEISRHWYSDITIYNYRDSKVQQRHYAIKSDRFSVHTCEKTQGRGKGTDI